MLTLANLSILDRKRNQQQLVQTVRQVFLHQRESCICMMQEDDRGMQRGGCEMRCVLMLMRCERRRSKQQQPLGLAHGPVRLGALERPLEAHRRPNGVYA